MKHIRIFLAILSLGIASSAYAIFGVGDVVFDPTTYAELGVQTTKLVESIGIQTEDLALAFQAFDVVTDQLEKLNELYDMTFGQFTELYDKTVAVYDKTVEIYDNAVALYDTTTLIYEEARGITEHGLMLPGSASELRTMLPELLPNNPAAVGSTAGAASLREQLEAFPEAEIFHRSGTPTKAAELYRAEGDMIFGYMSVVEELYNGLGERRETLAALTEAIGTAETQKTIQDLTARINAENTLMLNDMAQIQALQIMVDLQAQNTQRNRAAYARYSRTSTSDIDFSGEGS